MKFINHLFVLGFGVIAFAGCNSPKALFSFDQPTAVAPSEVFFDNQSEQAESYLWDFGDGNTSEDPNPTHAYKSSGKYVIILEAKKGNRKGRYEKEILIEAPAICLVEMETPFGNILLHLSDETPGHRDNFVKLVEEGYYDSLLFHRVIEGFMIQGGDPNSKGASTNTQLGSGGPGYQIPAEFVDTLVHVKGAIAAARTGDGVNPQKKSSGSQFYIVQGKPVDEQTLKATAARNGVKYSESNIKAYLESGGTPFLDGNYTVFGNVIEGFDVIDKIAATQTGQGDRPSENIWMKIKVIK